MRLTTTKAREILAKQTGRIELRHPDNDGKRRSVSAADAVARLEAGYVQAFGTRDRVTVLMMRPREQVYLTAAYARAEFNVTTVRHGLEFSHRAMDRVGPGLPTVNQAGRQHRSAAGEPALQKSIPSSSSQKEARV